MTDEQKQAIGAIANLRERLEAGEIDEATYDAAVEQLTQGQAPEEEPG